MHLVSDFPVRSAPALTCYVSGRRRGALLAAALVVAVTGGTAAATPSMGRAETPAVRPVVPTGSATAASPLTLRTPAVRAITRKVAYAATLSAGGGRAPYRFSLYKSKLPSGVVLAKNGRIRGTTSATTMPTTIRVRVADKTGKAIVGSVTFLRKVVVTASSLGPVRYRQGENSVLSVLTALLGPYKKLPASLGACSVHGGPPWAHEVTWGALYLRFEPSSSTAKDFRLASWDVRPGRSLLPFSLPFGVKVGTTKGTTVLAADAGAVYEADELGSDVRDSAGLYYLLDDVPASSTIGVVAAHPGFCE